MRRKVIAGNWKMNKSPKDVALFMTNFPELVKDADSEVVLCVPYIDLCMAMELAENTNVKIGAQNVHYEEKGAYTGEVSVTMLKDIGVEYVIIGHSERRQYYNETDESVNKKLKVGETLEQREAGITKDFVTTQVKLALEGVTSEDVAKTIIAYEPIWAIGTGKTASAQDANEVCAWVREEIRNLFGDVAEEVIIQYGGSVKSSNAAELFGMSDIDGGLVGGASLDQEEFSKIVNYNK